KPFTLRMPLDRLASCSAEQLRSELAQPGRSWAGHLLGPLFVLHEQGLTDLKRPTVPGLNLAVLSGVPTGVGLGSSAAMQAAAMCRHVQQRIMGFDRGISAAATSCCGQSEGFLRMLCQPPYPLQPPLRLPKGFRIIGIDTGPKSRDAGDRLRSARVAARM